jgi:predicted Zn-dependent protease
MRGFCACGIPHLGENLIVQPLQPPDVFHLRAAQGWLELGNHLEADAELDNIAPQLRAHPAVLELRWQIYAKEKKWDACRDLAEAITKLLPDEPVGWLHLAYATRRAAGGDEQAAFEALFPVAERFPEVWEIPYNLACYSSMLGNFDTAQSWLKKAMAIGEKTVQTLALDDPDLKPLWDSMSGTVWKKEGP